MQKGIKVSKRTYDRLVKLRKTDRGEVSFDAVIVWALDKAEAKYLP